MNPSGNIGTERLIQNLHNQLDRLVEQLQDIENSRYLRFYDVENYIFIVLISILSHVESFVYTKYQNSFDRKFENQYLFSFCFNISRFFPTAKVTCTLKHAF